MDDTVMGEELKRERKGNNEKGLKWGLEDGRDKKESERERKKEHQTRMWRDRRRGADGRVRIKKRGGR